MIASWRKKANQKQLGKWDYGENGLLSKRGDIWLMKGKIHCHPSIPLTFILRVHKWKKRPSNLRFYQKSVCFWNKDSCMSLQLTKRWFFLMNLFNIGVDKLLWIILIFPTKIFMTEWTRTSSLKFKKQNQKNKTNNQQPSHLYLALSPTLRRKIIINKYCHLRL